MWCFRSSQLYILLLWMCLNIVTRIEATPTRKKICIIGAGPAGLIAANEFRYYPDEFDVVVFDRSVDIGGVWKYTNNTDLDENNLPVHSSAYAYLRTIGPKEIMAMPQYREFLGEERSCVRHDTVLAYLKNFTNHFNLEPYIKLNHFVEKVTPIVRDDNWQNTKWLMKVRRLRSNEDLSVTCDGVLVANGRFVKGNIPKIPGIETFPGRVLHSHTYRWPQEFADKTVVVLGAGFSGIDISTDINKYAKTVYLSHNKDKIIADWPSNIIQVAGVLTVNGTTFTLRDGSTINADTLIFCTGYLLDFPFLDESSGITVERNYIWPLYKHLINIEHPSMALIGIPTDVQWNTLFTAQSKYFVSLMQGKAKLPSKKDMLKSAELNGISKKIAHSLNSNQWDYHDELAELGGFKKLPRFYEKALIMWRKYHLSDLLHYKESNMRITEEGEVTIIVRPNYPMNLRSTHQP